MGYPKRSRWRFRRQQNHHERDLKFFTISEKFCIGRAYL